MVMTFSEYDAKRDLLVNNIPNKNLGFYPNFESICKVLMPDGKNLEVCMDYFIWLTETSGDPVDSTSQENLKKIKEFMRNNLELIEDEESVEFVAE